jgi:hypothetical protein
MTNKALQNIFFFLHYFFGGTEVLIVYILLFRPSEDSLQQGASPSKGWQSTVG